MYMPIFGQMDHENQLKYNVLQKLSKYEFIFSVNSLDPKFVFRVAQSTSKVEDSVFCIGSAKHFTRLVSGGGQWPSVKFLRSFQTYNKI